MSRLTHLVSIVLAVAALSLTGCVSHQQVTIRVLTYNIHHGEGMDGVIDLERIAQVIRKTEADLVALQEVDRGVERTNRVDQPARLAALTGMYPIFEKNIDQQGGEYGNAILSRFPVQHHGNHHLPRLPSNEQRGLLEVHVTVDGQQVIFFATHFDHQADDSERMASVVMLRDLLQQRIGKPLIVAGDLNALPDSQVVQDVTVFLRDPFDAVEEEGFTFPADASNRRIDYILFREDGVLRCIEHRVIPENVASDHRPVLAVFEVER